MPCASGEVFLEDFSLCWEGLEDPRRGNAGLHDFHEILMIALCSVLCGGQGAVDMAVFAEAKEPLLREFLRLEHGIPSHDTFSRLFRLLDPEQFRQAFQGFMAKFSERLDEVIAIDGKTLRRSFDRASSKSALHMVSAWGCEQRLVLGQIATEAKSNEITAVPRLLEMLTLKGATVTADALLCQRAIAEQIVDQGGRLCARAEGQPARHARRRAAVSGGSGERSQRRRDRNRTQPRPHRESHRDRLDRRRLAGQEPSLALPDGGRQGGPQTRHGRENDDRNRLLPDEPAVIPRAAEPHRTPALGGGEQPALEARCGHE